MGDTITLRLEKKDGPAATWVIVGVYPEPADAGQRLMVNLSSVNRLVKINQPNTYYLKLNPTADIPAIRNFLAPQKKSDLNLVTVGEAIPESVIYLQLAIFALAGILIAGPVADLIGVKVPVVLTFVLRVFIKPRNIERYRIDLSIHFTTPSLARPEYQVNRLISSVDHGQLSGR